MNNRSTMFIDMPLDISFIILEYLNDNEHLNFQLSCKFMHSGFQLSIFGHPLKRKRQILTVKKNLSPKSFSQVLKTLDEEHHTLQGKIYGDLLHKKLQRVKWNILFPRHNLRDSINIEKVEKVAKRIILLEFHEDPSELAHDYSLSAVFDDVIIQWDCKKMLGNWKHHKFVTIDFTIAQRLEYCVRDDRISVKNTLTEVENGLKIEISRYAQFCTCCKPQIPDLSKENALKITSKLDLKLEEVYFLLYMIPLATFEFECFGLKFFFIKG